MTIVTTSCCSSFSSDDDLVPYDMSNDAKVTKVKQPKYIRDSMEGMAFYEVIIIIN